MHKLFAHRSPFWKLSRNTSRAKARSISTMNCACFGTSWKNREWSCSPNTITGSRVSTNPCGPSKTTSAAMSIVRTLGNSSFNWPGLSTSRMINGQPSSGPSTITTAPPSGKEDPTLNPPSGFPTHSAPVPCGWRWMFYQIDGSRTFPRYGWRCPVVWRFVYSSALPPQAGAHWPPGA